MAPYKNKREDLVFPEFSYKLVGILFDVYNTLGFGYQEKYYCRAIGKALKDNNLKFIEQFPVPLKYGDAKIGNYFIDFLVEGRVVLEIKRGNKFSKSNINQVYAYLKSADLKLGILANFTSDGIKFKRILNLDSYIRKNK